MASEAIVITPTTLIASGIPKRVGKESGQQCAGHATEIPPKTVDTDRNAPPRRLRDIADCGQKRGIDQRRSHAEGDECADPCSEALDHRQSNERTAKLRTSQATVCACSAVLYRLQNAVRRVRHRSRARQRHSL
jgi:hypothetical protein